MEFGMKREGKRGGLYCTAAGSGSAIKPRSRRNGLVATRRAWMGELEL